MVIEFVVDSRREAMNTQRMCLLLWSDGQSGNDENARAVRAHYRIQTKAESRQTPAQSPRRVSWHSLSESLVRQLLPCRPGASHHPAFIEKVSPDPHMWHTRV
jgi:hypothetical protein